VRGLQVNPFQPFLVASGATDAEVTKRDSLSNDILDLALGP
jgi:hypothetical protein